MNQDPSKRSRVEPPTQKEMRVAALVIGLVWLAMMVVVLAVVLL